MVGQTGLRSFPRPSERVSSATSSDVNFFSVEPQGSTAADRNITRFYPKFSKWSTIVGSVGTLLSAVPVRSAALHSGHTADKIQYV